MLRQLARDRSALLGLILVLLVVVAAILAPLISTHPEAVWDMNPANRLKPPSSDWLLGTDRMGADIYSRVIYGARITLLIAFVAVGAALLIGVPIGLWAGWNEFWIGEALMRVSDVFLAVPQIVLAIAIAQTLGPSIENVILALSVTYWPWFARLVYAEVRTLKNETFIEAAIALGVPNWRIVAAARASQRHLADHRAHLDRHGLHDPDGCLARLPRPRRAAAGAGMGPHDLRVARIPSRGLVVCPGAGPRHLYGGDGL